MGMVVRTNTMAVNAFRQLGMNNTKVAKSLEKLASGYRINRAGDDASGLAISEKMKAQIKGLETASANSQDGISLIQTAEGALTEVHDMLNRMVELAGKSANGTMDDTVDRKALQAEADALKSEIDRIAQGTNFNGITLLDGSLDGGAASVTGTYGTMKMTIGAGADFVGKNVTISSSAAALTNGAQFNITYDGTDLKVELSLGSSYSAADIEAAVKDFAATGLRNNEIARASGGTDDGFDDQYSALQNFTLKAPGTIVAAASATTGALTTAISGAGGLRLQVGDTAALYNQITVSVADMSWSALGLSTVSVADQDLAASSLQMIKDAINTVSTTRADLGALQNRLEHTINNLDVAAENMTAANSRIRDTDMAKEMMEYTKMNVLTQAAQAMLAQATQQPQSILQLLQ